LIERKKGEPNSSEILRKVKSVQNFSDVICENCISYNQGRCCYALPFVPVAPDNKCHEGQWLHKGQNFHGICHYLVPDRLVQDIQDLECGECIFYNPTKKECHFYRENVYKSGHNDWCHNGEWVFKEQDNWVISGSLGFLYPRLMENRDR
jgi:hypothetical protein